MAAGQASDAADFERSKMIQRLTLRPGERRGYWRYYSQRLHRQTIVRAYINDYSARVLLDSGAEVSILDSDFARKIGVEVDTSETLRCEGVGGAGFATEGRAKIKVVLGGELAYECDVWVGRLGGLQAILGTDFMTPAGIRLDLADGVALMPDEVRVRFEGRRALYSDRAEQVRITKETTIFPGNSVFVRLRPPAGKRLWLRRAEHWVSTAECNGQGQPIRLKVTNIHDRPVFVSTQTVIGLWLAPGSAPRHAGYVSIGSKRYDEWCTLVYEAEPEPELERRRDTEVERIRASQPPSVERPVYATPRAILPRSRSRSADDSGSADEELASSRSGSPTAADWAKAAILFVSAKAAAEALVAQSDLSDAIFVHEGGDVSAEEIEGQMAMIPEAPAADQDVTPEDIKIAGGEGVSPEEVARVREMIWRRRPYLMGPGNARPLPAKGVVCDIDVGNAQPITQRCRKVPPQFVDKLYELLKGLLQAGFIAPSTSPWASPIVIVVKKNGVDIRLCIDYRMVNSLTKLMVYPMPIVHDLLENLGSLKWLCSLDMASGFWVVKMTARARAISAFVTPFGLFEWLRMPFGLKNAPQIYQRLLDNTLYGYLKMKPKHLLDEEAAVFQDGEPADQSVKPAIGRRSYIDDILFDGETWEEMCDRLERLLQACEEWGRSISLPKSEFGMRQVDFLGHTVSADGIGAKPKNLQELADLAFPKTIKGIQSFLGSLNYYHQFVEHFTIFAASVYEVTEADLAVEAREPGHLATAKWAFTELKDRLVDLPILKHFDGEKQPIVIIYANAWAITGSLIQEHDGQLQPIKFFSRVLKAHELKFAPAEKEVLALLHVLSAASKLLSGRQIRVLTRHSTLRWLFHAKGLQGRLEKWVVALSPWSLEIERIKEDEDSLSGLLAAAIGPADHVDEMLASIQPRKRSAETQYRLPVPVLSADQPTWVVSFDGSAKPKRAGASCGVVLWKVPEWTVVDAKTFYFDDGTVNEAEYRGAIAAMDLALQHSADQVIICGDSRIVIQQLRGDIECRTPGLQVLRAEALDRLVRFKSAHLMHVAREFNAAADLITGKALQRCSGGDVLRTEYAGMELLNRLHEVLRSADPADDTQRVNVVTRSGRGVPMDPDLLVDGDLAAADQVDNAADQVSEVGCHGAPAEDQEDRPLVAVAPADRVVLEGEDLDKEGESDVLEDEGEVRQGGRESSTEGSGDHDSADRTTADQDETGEMWVQRLRAQRAGRAQREESWSAWLIHYLVGDVDRLDSQQVDTCAKLADTFEVIDDLLYYVGSRKSRDRLERSVCMRLVIPTTLCREVLHHYHVSLAGGHQGVSRVYERVTRLLYWRGMYNDVRNYVFGCPDCQSGKGVPRITVRSPGNLVATRPFQVIGMDHVPSLPRSARGNTELLVWVDHHTGYVIVSANASRTAQEVAESYGRCVYRRFGASQTIRHDREPAFMSEVFRAFNRLIGQRSRATLAYRPQANGMTERMVQTVMTAVKLYVSDPKQRDWDDYAERLVFALNASHDRVRGDSPFYLLHGWEARTTLEATLPTQDTSAADQDAQRWRSAVQTQYQKAREDSSRLLQQAMEAQSEKSAEHARGDTSGIVKGAKVWIYINQVKKGFARKLAHLWHGPFRVLEKPADHLVKIEIDDKSYRLFPTIHISRLKLWREFEDRPTVQLEVPADQRFDFDEALLPEDSLEPNEEGGEYEVEATLDHDDVRGARQGRRVRHYKVKWVGYDEPSWVAEEDMNAQSLVNEYEQRLRARGRYAAMDVEE